MVHPCKVTELTEVSNIFEIISNVKLMSASNKMLHFIMYTGLEGKQSDNVATLEG